VINFLRVERPQRESQMSECYGAGTGCGWCRPFLKKLFEAARAKAAAPELPAADEYARGRTGYVRAGKGTPPPGATPIEGE
jgi:bacterioferritin-associated ferredoxin